MNNGVPQPGHAGNDNNVTKKCMRYLNAFDMKTPATDAAAVSFYHHFYDCNQETFQS
jgi:hypothetical protein